MTKKRDPFSWPGAVRRAIELVGAEAIAEELQNHGAKIRVQAVYDWSDPDTGSQPIMWQGEAIDGLCAREAGERPFSRVWSARADVTRAKGECPMGLTVAANATMATLVSEMNKALGDSHLSENERARLNDLVAKMFIALGAVKAEVNAAPDNVTLLAKAAR